MYKKIICLGVLSGVLVILAALNIIYFCIVVECLITKITDPPAPGLAEFQSAFGWAVDSIVSVIFEIIYIFVLLKIRKYVKKKVNDAQSSEITD